MNRPRDSCSAPGTRTGKRHRRVRCRSPGKSGKLGNLVISFSYITMSFLQLARIPEGDTSAQQVFQERPPGEAAETVSKAQ